MQKERDRATNTLGSIAQFLDCKDSEEQRMSLALNKILQDELLTPLYQPIANLQSGKFVGYEGLIRGPSNSPLHSPTALFRLAKTRGLTIQLEGASRKVLLKQFAAQGLKGKLFLNVSPEVLMIPNID